jgi:hypothetical protein
LSANLHKSYCRKLQKQGLIRRQGVQSGHLPTLVLHLWENGAKGETLLSSFFHQGKQDDLCGKDISKGLKMAAALLHYPATHGILIEWADTHSLQSRGANALALSGYSNTQIKKMGRWNGTTFKKYF